MQHSSTAPAEFSPSRQGAPVALQQGFPVPLQQQVSAAISISGGTDMAATAPAAKGDVGGVAFSPLQAGTFAADSTGVAQGMHRLARPPRLTPVWPEDAASDRVSTAGSMGSVVVHDSEDEPEIEMLEPSGLSAPPPTPAGNSQSMPGLQKVPSLFQRRQQRAANSLVGDCSTGPQQQPGAPGVKGPLRGLKSLKALITPADHPYMAEHITAPAPGQAGNDSTHTAAAGDVDGNGSQQASSAAPAAGSGTPAGALRGAGGAGRRSGWGGNAAEALGLSDEYSPQPRVTGGSEESDENSADEATGPLGHKSFRRRSVKQLARGLGRAGGETCVWDVWACFY